MNTWSALEIRNFETSQIDHDFSDWTVVSTTCFMSILLRVSEDVMACTCNALQAFPIQPTC